MYAYYNLVCTTVITRPDDDTICKGRSKTLTCLLDSSISSDNVQWYRLLKDSTSEMVAQGSNIHFTTSTINNAKNSSLTITNAIKSYTGYYWVRLPSDDVCNVSLTVLDAESMYVNRIRCNCTYIHFE